MIPGKQHTFKIVLTGPESSGKTQVAQALAAALQTVWVPEFARHYVGHLGRPYCREDLHQIARGQAAWEEWYRIQASRFLICDTDWTVLHIWENVRFGFPETGNWAWQSGYRSPTPADLYLLCLPDFPWQPDPLRENPNDRMLLFQWYEQLLLGHNARFLTLSGSPGHRLQLAISQIDKLFGLL